MDRSQSTFSAVDDLKKIESQTRRSTSLNDLRQYFERIQSLRRAFPDDFDLQVRLAEVQELVIERARVLRGEPASNRVDQGRPSFEGESYDEPRSHRHDDAAEIPPEVERLDPKSWQRAIYIGLFFAVILFAAFFYLIQTARRLNMTPAETADQTAAETKAAAGAKPPATNASAPPVPTRPTLRLYTDLVPGSVSTDNNPPQALKDGELVLDNVEPGHHSMKVTGRSGEAEFSYDVTEKAAPKVVGLPIASNVMAVLVSTEDRKARLVSNVDRLQVALDGKSVGTADSDGLALDNLGTADHDLEVSEGNDHQRFVLTYTPAPALTVYVKSDPSAGTVVVVTGQDGAEVYINNAHYRRQTEHGQIRIPNLKVGQYTIRVHKAGFLDPPPAIVHVKKAEETRAEFHLQPVPQIATLEIKGALPGTMVYVDGDLAAAIEGGGGATISNVKPGSHAIELRRDGAPTKKMERTFNNGDVVLLSGPEVVLNKAAVESQPNTPSSPSTATSAEQARPETSASRANASMQLPGEQVRKGGGFVPYHTPRVAGHYTFAVMNRKGGFLKHGKIQWYAGFQNGENYVLFILDGKRGTVRRVVNDKSEDVSRVSFNFEEDEWVQVDLSVKPNSINARVRHPDGPWVEMGDVESTAGADFTKDRVGFYIPGSDELSVSNFRFSPR